MTRLRRQHILFVIMYTASSVRIQCAEEYKQSITPQHATEKLGTAAHNGQLGDVHNWLDLGAKVNAILLFRDPKNPKRMKETTALIQASGNGHCRVVAALLNSNADPNLGRASGATPLMLASQQGHEDTVINLLDANAAVNTSVVIKDSKGKPNIKTALSLAIMGGHTLVSKVLIDAKADVNAPCGDGATPLYTAVCCDCPDIACMLLNAGADKSRAVNEKPLIAYAKNDAMKMILEKGEQSHLRVPLLMNHYVPSSTVQ